MNRHSLTACIVLSGASLLAGCEAPSAETDTAPSEFRATPGFDDDVAAASSNFEKRMADAYALPKAANAPSFKSYGALLETYLLAAGDHDEDETTAALETIHAVLRNASAREFVMFYRALGDAVLAGAVDAKGEPLLRPIDVAAIPLVLMLHDMGARQVDSELAVWLFLRRDAVAQAWAKPSAFATAGVFVDHGDGLLRMPLADQEKVVAAITGGTFLAGCGLDELQTPVGDTPLCPAECEFDVAKLGLDDAEAAAMQAWCDVMGGELLPDLNPDTADVMLTCLDAYESALGRDDLSVCLVESFASLSNDPFPSYEGRTNVRIARECTLTTTDPEDVAQDAGEDAATGAAEAADTAEKLNRLNAQRDRLQQTINVLDDAVQSIEDNWWWKKADAVVAPIKADLSDEMYEIDDQINELKNGGSGSKRCAFDTQACTSSCDIQNAVQQATEACLQTTSKKDALSSPDPIDPPQPIVDPDSPLGVLTSCLADAALADEDTGSCGMNFRCLDGKQAEEVDGVCLCPGERSSVPPELGCDETILCVEGPCSCEGAPLTGDGGAPPQPDPFMLFQFRG